MTVHIKGIVLKARVEYLKKTYGDEEFKRLLQNVSPETRKVISASILVSSWYPFSVSVEAMVAADRLFGKGDFEIVRATGRASAQLALQGVHQSFAREHDPSFVIKMAPLLWTQYYDSGRMEAESISQEGAVTRVFEFAEPHRTLCVGIIGWMEAAIEIWGGTEVRVDETKCSARGGAHCEFLSSWKDPLSRPVG